MMYVLDTNVVSELRKAKAGKADARVVAWAQGITPGCLFISAITVMEIEMGVLQMERRDLAQSAVLRAWLNDHVLTAFEGRILSIDLAVAQKCAKLHVPNMQSERDALIAATALVHGMSVVTRNVDDFKATGVAIINPWSGP
ncbi:MAG: type II toxin-antitoxin system VapC family toxin [Burkholderiales bacterium]|nr:type II toxin-antitoxin system VapC family toxin [Burkholderiales bacterium]